MNKILFLCDGDHFPKGAFEFIKQLNGNGHISAKGLFFTELNYQQDISPFHLGVADPLVVLEKEARNQIMQSKKLFKDGCEKANIKCEIQDLPEGWNLAQFEAESRFVDLVVISEELFCSDLFDEQPNYFMEEALRRAECPVMVVPEAFERIDRLAVAYDGKKESMFALKQFVHLLPQFTELPAEFIYIDRNPGNEIPNQSLLQDYASAHFESLATTKLEFEASKFLTTWLEEKQNVLLIAGAYARSAVSNFFNNSFAGKVIRDHTSPVFIAHHV